MEKKLYAIPLMAVALVVAISGCTVPGTPKISYEDFTTACTSSGGQLFIPTCGSISTPNCPTENTICGCGRNTSISYNQVKNAGFSGCTGTTEGDKKCTSSGGRIELASCCGNVGDYPNTCAIGACGCAPQDSHQVKICTCLMGQCFNGQTCGGISVY